MTTAKLAEKLGLSRGTISRVLNNHPNVKEETRQLVLTGLKEFNYTPNESAQVLASGKVLRIAVIVFSEPAFFWQQVERGVQTAHKDLAVRGLMVEYFITDILQPQEQLHLLRTLPHKGYDGIVIAPNDTQLLSEEVAKLCDSGYPVVVINADIAATNYLCYLGCDYVQAGVMAAELLSKFLQGKGRIAVLTLQDSISPIEQRLLGFRKELARHKKMSILQINRFDRKATGVYESVKKMLQENSDVDGIFVSIAALEQTAKACKEIAPGSQPVIVGYDLNQEIYSFLKKGIIAATICHEPFSQGMYAVKILHRYLSKKISPSSSVIYTKLEAILASNAQYYVSDQTMLEMFTEAL